MVRVTEEHRAEWKLGADYNVARITEMKNAANATLALYWIKEDPDTATVPNTRKFRISYKKMTETARHYQHWIKGNTLVPADILENFMIGPRDPIKHEAKSEPYVAPGNAAERPGLDTLIVVSFQTEDGGKRMTVRDDVNERVVRRYAITPHDQPLPLDLKELPWITLAPTRKMSRKFTLDSACNGMVFNLQTAFYNDRGQGPWSELYRITIS